MMLARDLVTPDGNLFLPGEYMLNEQPRSIEQMWVTISCCTSNLNPPKNEAGLT